MLRLKRVHYNYFLSYYNRFHRTEIEFMFVRITLSVISIDFDFHLSSLSHNKNKLCHSELQIKTPV